MSYTREDTFIESVGKACSSLNRAVAYGLVLWILVLYGGNKLLAKKNGLSEGANILYTTRRVFERFGAKFPTDAFLRFCNAPVSPQEIVKHKDQLPDNGCSNEYGWDQ